ncbi:hypothetical protein CFN78_13850 [Amycolatopsis antarctica]|uniref:ESX-1 secretion-associated protein n=1 Tax=Amycolatopsis antarctica TaxID=1854586 RepID=A0A263D5N0_9PSEU|nr:hypothetical protein [Amycolatopsis antarctica]OZM72705.1 hypothetical protein CFN78_13850 [Amycolatopsis antarctica]
MTAPGGFEVDPLEVDEHARHVDHVQARLETALDAANQRLGSEDFGIVGRGLAQICNENMESVIGTLRAAVDAGHTHVDSVRKWAEAKRVDEESVQALLNQVKI